MFSTLEPPWRDNAAKVSCIPVGRYTAEAVIAPRYGRTYLVKDVPGRSGIILHAGNLRRDTKGCPLLGTGWGRIDGEPAVLNSKLAMEEFRRIAWEDNRVVTLIVENG